MPAKEELLLAPVRYGGAAIVHLLEGRPAGESPDVALINAIITRTRSFEPADTEEWRQALLVAPGLLDKVTVHRPADKERATKLIADRMRVDFTPTSALACWSNWPSPPRISAFSSGCSSPGGGGRWTATSPKRSRPSKVRTGGGNERAQSRCSTSGLAIRIRVPSSQASTDSTVSA